MVVEPEQTEAAGGEQYPMMVYITEKGSHGFPLLFRESLHRERRTLFETVHRNLTALSTTVGHNYT